MAPTNKKAGKKGAAAPVKPAAVAGKKKAPAAKPAPVPAPPADEIDEDEDDEDWEDDEEEDDDDSEDDEDEDEENGGVSEKGMKRLLELVGPEDLDEFEIARLGSDEDEDEDDEEDDEEIEADDDEEEEDNTILVAEADPDAVAVDELGSDVSVDEDAVPMRKLTTSNKPAMRVLTEGIKMTNTPWPEHLISQSSTILEVDPSDDLQREMAFYKLALEAVPAARKLANKFGIPFTRPNDYYAEMVKSDEHMERVRTKLVEEAQGIKKSEEAKKQRELKKYGKQIQVENLKAREQDKKSFADRVAGIKRKRKDGAEIGDEGDDDEFGIGLEEDGPRGGGRAARGRGAGGKSKMPRSARDAKYSLGGSSRRAKQNDRESANDFSSFGSEHKRGGGKGGRGGKAGGAGGRGGKAGGATQRPGKSKRHSRRK
ncbi:rRNA-processing protein EBP2 [Vanrija albida]|uniref:rRNA-processing protein EBP2 n=1 Tax=Vanrija albida TaxID=181172 RepID=A0ABR3QDM9_9TREE